MKQIILWFLTALFVSALTGCSSNDSGTNVASSDEMAAAVEVQTDGLTPLDSGQLKDGVYPVAVDSSSSMFNITACELTVIKDGMTAKMTMGGTGYKWVYMGTAEEAADGSEDTYIPYEEAADGTHSFTVPVEKLDKAVDCAAFSSKKEKWYARTLVFRSDSLPVEAFKDGVLTTAGSLGLADGHYTADVQLKGGSGKASVMSPAAILVKNGKCTATLIWSSPNYDYMIADGQKYDAQISEGHSSFNIPVSCFDRNIAVIADTVAMSAPHEIEYVLRFDSASLAQVP